MENFIVSARKYRPATFESVVGQSHITSTLKNAISRGQLAHAYLFCGPRGVGKTTCARIFAKTINCQNPNAAGDACGECESCRSFDEGRSFTIHELDAASNNSVEDIRNLTEQVRVPPQVGRYSVYIIDEVHMLSPSAFNAFLKTLEEPPAHAIFILATTEKHKIIPTILSRCQIFDFNRIRVEDAVGYLKQIAQKEGVVSDDESLHLIAQKADGGMRDALSMFDKAVSFCGGRLSFRDVASTLNVLDYDTYFTMTDTIRRGDYRTALVAFDQILKKGFSGRTFAAGLASHFRDLLMCKEPQTLPLLEVTGSVLERYGRQATDCDSAFLFSGIALLQNLDAGYKTATNKRLHVELGIMRLCGLGEQKKSESLNEAAPLHELQKQPARQSQPPKTEQPTPLKMSPTATVVAESNPVKSTDNTTAGNSVTEPTVRPTTVAPQSAPIPEEPSLPHDNRSEDSKTAAVRKPVFGGSITAILSGVQQEVEGEGGEEPLEVHYDPETEEKIERNRAQFLAELQKERPRIAPAMADMIVSGHTVSTMVYTEMIREEILHNRREMVDIFRRTCDLKGEVDFDITVNRDQKRQLPVKAEDRFKFLADKNPEMLNLVKELNLDID